MLSFNRIIKALRWAFGSRDDDINALARDALSVVSPDAIPFANRQMTEIEWRRLYLASRKITEIQAFGEVLGDLIAAQRNLIATNSVPTTIEYMQGVLEGVTIARRRFEVLSAKVDIKKQDFDPYKVI